MKLPDGTGFMKGTLSTLYFTTMRRPAILDRAPIAIAPIIDKVREPCATLPPNSSVGLIDMNVVPNPGRGGRGVDPILTHLEPVRQAELPAGQVGEVFQDQLASRKDAVSWRAISDPSRRALAFVRMRVGLPWYR